jgi:hypothetical protein
MVMMVAMSTFGTINGLLIAGSRVAAGKSFLS